MLLVNAKDFSLTFFVITDRASSIVLLLKVNGAISEEFDEIKTLCLILVLLFLIPS